MLATPFVLMLIYSVHRAVKDGDSTGVILLGAFAWIVTAVALIISGEQ